MARSDCAPARAYRAESRGDNGESMRTESDTHMMYTTTDTEHDLMEDELDRAHEAFLAEIVHLDGKAAQRLLKTIAEDGTVASPALRGDGQNGGGAG